MGQPVGLIGRVFLAADSPRTMLHVAALLRFSPPPSPSPRYLADLADEVRAELAVASPWNLKLVRPRLGLGMAQQWEVDHSIDLDYHVRRSALPSPGDERELGTLVSRLHGRQVDLSRPPWEMHLIEGLDDGGFAMFVKMPHALVDGYTGMRLLQRSLSTDPSDMDSPILFAPHRPPRQPSPAVPGSGAAEPARPTPLQRTLSSSKSLTCAVAQTVSPLGRPHLVRPYEAPRTIFNTRIGRSRRFATQQLDLDAVRTLGREHGATVNDVCLSLVGGALRTYLRDLDELPTRPLIALVPMSTRPEGDPGGGNAFGAVLASLGTDIEEPLERLEAVTASMTAAKSQVAGMGQLAAVGYTSLLAAPMLAQVGLAAVGAPLPGPFSFNLIVSNVPGPQEPRYFRGSRLEAMYPASLQIDAAALNITLLSYAGALNIGFSGDRDAVPHLQRLALGLAQAWESLRSATS